MPWLPLSGWESPTWWRTPATPAASPPRDEDLIISTVAFILGLAGWAVVWRQEGRFRDTGVTANWKWAVFWGLVYLLLFWGAGLWFLISALIA
ncbi:MAG: hypothetical protein WD740_01755 [Anaerolineales bacterium]